MGTWQSSSAWMMTWIDPLLPLVEFAKQMVDLSKEEIMVV